MTTLLCLPAEILSEIINLTLPDGIEAFALSCKTVHACAASQIRRHNALRKTWARTADASVHLLFCLFGDSEVDPLAAQYVEELDLWNLDGNPERTGYNRRYFAEADDVDGGDEARIHRDKLNRVKEVVTGLRYLKDANVDPDQWWEALVKADLESVEEGDDTELEQNSVISLLGLLPNLKILTLPDFQELSPQDETKLSVLDTMVQSSNSSGGALAKLKTIMPFSYAGYHSRAGLQTVEPFLRLIALREMYLVSCLAVDGCNSGIPFQWRFPKLNSRLRRIELAYCCMDTEGISELLKHTPELEVFKYDHETKWHGCLHDWNAGTFVEAVGQHVGSTITQLAITVYNAFGEMENGATSFHSFSKLKDLEVDVRIFCGPPVESGQRRGLDEKLPKGVNPWKEKDLPSLASMLPSSVTNVQITARFTIESREDAQPEEVALLALLTQFEDDRQARLPELDKVVIRTFNMDTAKTVLEATGANVDIHCPEHVRSESDSSHRPGLTAWKREFEQRVGGIKTAY